MKNVKISKRLLLTTVKQAQKGKYRVKKEIFYFSAQKIPL